MQHLTWDPPAPGPWTQDSAHNPVAQTLIMQDVYPDGFEKGFTETFAAFGVLLDRLAMGVVNGFTYHQPQPFDMPGPDGPKDPDWIGEEFGRRAATADRAMSDRIWRDAMRRWDAEVKPAAQARHVEFGSVDLIALTDEQLSAHLDACCAHVSEMVYQHHRYNAHTLIPVGDFLIQAAAWTQRPPHSMFAVFDGYSPVSNVSPPEMQAALEALRADPDARELLHSDQPALAVLAELRARIPEIDSYVGNVHFRLVEGFDVSNPTIGERPECIVGRLRAALEINRDTSIERANAFAAELRVSVPAGHQAAFDDLLTDARLVYRLRDERGMYSDIAAIGLLRLALLEVGRRQQVQGRLHQADDILDATLDELHGILAGADHPSADELRDRVADRIARTRAGAPRYLGPPAPPPPPIDMLPPSLGRVMGAIGFAIHGVLGQLDEPAGDASTVVGIPGADGIFEGPARIIRSIEDLMELESGEVLVAPTTGEAFNSMLHLVGAIVTDHGSFASHAAIVSREMGIPAVVGTVDATRRINTGSLLRVDGAAGTVTLI